MKVKTNAPGGAAAPPASPASEPPPVAAAPPPPPPPKPAPAPAPAPQAVTAAPPTVTTTAVIPAPAPQSVIVRPADLPDYLDVHGGEGVTPGFENVGASGLSLPMLRIAQPQTPGVLVGKLKGGDVYLHTDPEKPLFGLGQQADFSIAFHYREWIEWADRESKLGILNRSKKANGDLAARWAKQWSNRGGPPETRVVGDKTVKISISEYHVMFIVWEGEREPFAVPMHRTMYKKGQLLLSLARRRGPGVPIYAGKYTMSTKMETNAKGSWYNYDYKTAGWVAKEDKDFMAQAYKQARDMYESASSIALDLASEDALPEAEPGEEKAEVPF